MTLFLRSSYQGHPFHLVSPSPWPIYSSFSLFALAATAALVLHAFFRAGYIWIIAFILVPYTMSLWFRDIISEGTFLGFHTYAVQKGLHMGIASFIVSEALFFLGIFWAYFHSAIAPHVELGANWPPFGIESINAFELPLLNTILLLASGVIVTFGHHSLIQGNRNGSLFGTLITLILAIFFTTFQGIEYSVSSFTLSDSTYGSCFFFGTGFHGLHVIIGAIFIAVGFVRLLIYHLTDNHHVGFESSLLYWHFVDIVWLVLYLGFYYYTSE